MIGCTITLYEEWRRRNSKISGLCSIIICSTSIISTLEEPSRGVPRNFSSCGSYTEHRLRRVHAQNIWVHNIIRRRRTNILLRTGLGTIGIRHVVTIWITRPPGAAFFQYLITDDSHRDDQHANEYRHELKRIKTDCIICMEFTNIAQRSFVYSYFAMNSAFYIVLLIKRIKRSNIKTLSYTETLYNRNNKITNVEDAICERGYLNVIMQYNETFLRWFLLFYVHNIGVRTRMCNDISSNTRAQFLICFCDEQNDILLLHRTESNRTTGWIET